MNVPRPNRPLYAKRRDWRITFVLVLTVLVVSMLAVGTPAVISSSNTGRQIQRGADIQGCRSAASADVTDKRNDVDQARVVKDVLEITFLTAITTGDKPVIVALAPRFTAISAVLTKAGAELDKANATYKQAIRLSSTDPNKFLKMCQEGT